MFDIGWLELMVIGIVALIVVGPEDLPMMFRKVGRIMGQMRGMAREFQRSMEEAADQTGLREATSELNKVRDFGIKSPSKSARSQVQSWLKDEDKPSGAKSAAAKNGEDTSAEDKAETEADLAEAAADNPMPETPNEAPEVKRGDTAESKPEG